LLTILLDGIAYGMLLFILAVGLCVTLGLMNFINLAHGTFAMAGGYLTITLMQKAGVPFLLCLPAAFIFAAVLGLVLERTLYRHLYDKTHLDQVLFSIGLVFISIAMVDYAYGANQQIVNLPDYLTGRFAVLGASIGVYRVFVIAICGLLVVSLQLVLTMTRFGSHLRAAVDDGRVARGMGIDVTRIFAVTFAVGSGLAGLGGALAAPVVSVGPGLHVQIIIDAFVVVVIGGMGSVMGALVASLLVGVINAYGVLAFPGWSVVMTFVCMAVVLIVRPWGLFGSPE
jgi:branched-chain amino acid transport system permease protein